MFTFLTVSFALLAVGAAMESAWRAACVLAGAAIAAAMLRDGALEALLALVSRLP